MAGRLLLLLLLQLLLLISWRLERHFGSACGQFVLEPRWHYEHRLNLLQLVRFALLWAKLELSKSCANSRHSTLRPPNQFCWFTPTTPLHHDRTRSCPIRLASHMTIRDSISRKRPTISLFHSLSSDLPSKPARQLYQPANGWLRVSCISGLGDAFH